MAKLGMYPAFPRAGTMLADGGWMQESAEFGMTLRAYIATHALAGILATGGDTIQPLDWNVRRAIEHADALLAELESGR